MSECLFCEERIDTEEEKAASPIHTIDGPREVHWQCALREVLGGIGHLIAHEYWCGPQGDPDAGLTYRQSALLAAEWVRVVGVEHE